MTSRHEEFLDLCAAHALGILDDADRGRFEELLREGGESHQRILAELTDAAAQLAHAAPAVVPPPALKARVLAALGDPPARSSNVVALRPERPWWPVTMTGWAAAAVFALLFMARARIADDLRRELALLETERTQLVEALAEEKAWAGSMASPAARVAFLAATPDVAAQPNGWALFDPDSRRAIVVLENLTPSAEADFELWAIEGGTPRSLGVIAVDASGRAVVRLTDAADPAAQLAAFAVSREGKGGSPDKHAPAGPVVLVGALGA
jgi:anti-sigma-K factor RskA